MLLLLKQNFIYKQKRTRSHDQKKQELGNLGKSEQ